MYILEKESSKPLYIQLYDAIKDEISHHLKAGAKLPSVRKVAIEYKISKNTVELAYKQLYAEGYIESVPKSGYFVTDTLLETHHDTSVMQKAYVEPQSVLRYDFFPARLTHDSFPLKLWKRVFIQAMKAKLREKKS